jgi:CarD family transcriptional regulator
VRLKKDFGEDQRCSETSQISLNTADQKDLMQLKIDDLVVHPAFGIGHIIQIEEKKFSEKGTRLYYKVSQFRRTLWIRVEAQEANGLLRRVTAKRDLDQYRGLLKSAPIPLNANLQQRQRELTNPLKQGSLWGMCEVVRDLTAWNWRGPLGPADTITLHKTRDSLYQEWAIAASISPTEARQEIDALLPTWPAYDRG